MINIEREFHNISGFPLLIGAADGSHINIKAPEKVQAGSLGGTMKYTVILRAVSTIDKRFSYIQAGFPGSAHSSRVFKST